MLNIALLLKVFGVLHFNVTFIVEYILGVIKFTEDSCNLMNPTFFIFAEKDEVIPLDQVRHYFKN